jgi:signal transduction histidine kinase
VTLRPRRRGDTLAGAEPAPRTVLTSGELEAAWAHPVLRGWLRRGQRLRLLATRDNEHSAPAPRTLGDTGRQAMDELRRVLGALRDDQDDEGARLTPQPAIGDLDTLLARVRAAGLPVTYRTAGDLAGLSSGLQLTVYRIVQESLTNTLKHAGTAATCEVSVLAEAGAVTVRVVDTGTGTGTPADAPVSARLADEADKAAQAGAAVEGGGHGLVGIRQRAALYNGSVTIGPRPDQPGWIVDVRLDATVEPTHPAHWTTESRLP